MIWFIFIGIIETRASRLEMTRLEMMRIEIMRINTN
jgi:hypothetical protein